MYLIETLDIFLRLLLYLPLLLPLPDFLVLQLVPVLGIPLAHRVGLVLLWLLLLLLLGEERLVLGLGRWLAVRFRLAEATLWGGIEIPTG